MKEIKERIFFLVIYINIYIYIFIYIYIICNIYYIQYILYSIYMYILHTKKYIYIYTFKHAIMQQKV